MPFQSTVGDYKTVATLETFGFLPPMTQDEIYDQIAYIIAQGWSPLIEHVHPSNSMATYWSYWKLPFFGEKDLNVVVSQDNVIGRMNGFDPLDELSGLVWERHQRRKTLGLRACRQSIQCLAQ